MFVTPTSLWARMAQKRFDSIVLDMDYEVPMEQVSWKHQLRMPLRKGIKDSLARHVGHGQTVCI